MKIRFRLFTLMFAMMLFPVRGIAWELPNLRVKTLGGMQFWTDVHLRQGWKIQRHIWTGHHRLLNRGNVRYMWGSYDSCMRYLNELHDSKESEQIQILLVHGLGRSHFSMLKLQKKLKNLGIDSRTFEYSSLMGSTQMNAQALQKVILDFPGKTLLVTHSYGGIISRRMLCFSRDLPLAQVIMAAPPNQGSHIAEQLSKFGLDIVLGKARHAFKPDCEFHCSRLPVFSCSTRVIGGKNAIFPLGFLMPERSDGIVLLKNIRLAGCEHIEIEGGCHTVLMHHPRVIREIQKSVSSIKKKRL